MKKIKKLIEDLEREIKEIINKYGEMGIEGAILKFINYDREGAELVYKYLKQKAQLQFVEKLIKVIKEDIKKWHNNNWDKLKQRHFEELIKILDEAVGK